MGRRPRQGAGLAAAAAILFAAGGAPAAAQEPVTRVELRSDPGDFVGDGRTMIYTPEDAAIRIGGSPTFIGLDVKRGEEEHWEGTFTPPAGQRLVPGRYAGATRHPFNHPGPGMDVSFDTGCNELSGEFTVVSIGYDGDRIDSLHLEFVQHCEHLPPALRGTLLYRVSEPAAAPEPAPGPDPVPAPAAPGSAPSVAATPPRLETTIRPRFRTSRGGTVVRSLRLDGPWRGVTVRIGCFGGRGSCPFERRRVAAARGTDLARLFDGRRLRPRTVIAIRITKPGATGRYLRFTTRSRSRAPRRWEGCLPPGARRPVGCRRVGRALG
jgi:hypothetical protein